MTKKTKIATLGALGAALAFGTVACSVPSEPAATSTSSISEEVEPLDVTGPSNSFEVAPGEDFHARITVPPRMVAFISAGGRTPTSVDLEIDGIALDEDHLQTFLPNATDRHVSHRMRLVHQGDHPLYVEIQVRKPEDNNRCWLDGYDARPSCPCQADDPDGGFDPSRVFLPGSDVLLGACWSQDRW